MVDGEFAAKHPVGRRYRWAGVDSGRAAGAGAQQQMQAASH